ncbi:MAG: aspartate/glutamate racemase family protein [Lachnospiraceae bacterium]|nr:aspartate/glutamate racemase family protein [Lachnospiraceae bacterium]
MKKIGLVGGTGPESTLMYYKELNTRTDKITHGAQMPEITIESVDFRKAWDMVSNDKYDRLGEYLSEKVNYLRTSGAEIISLTAVSMHAVIDQIINNTQVSLVSIPMAVCREAVKKGYKKVGC